MGLIDIQMTMHHWACIIGMSAPLTSGVSGNYIVMGMFVAEGSNAFMHIRSILRNYGLRYTKAYELVEISFMMIYIFGRIFVGVSIVYSTCACEHNHMLMKIAAIGLLIQTFQFTSQMMTILKKRFKEISDRKIHRIKMRWFEPLTDVELDKLNINPGKKEDLGL